jgi:hypothetical protein
MRCPRCRAQAATTAPTLKASIYSMFLHFSSRTILEQKFML